MRRLLQPFAIDLKFSLPNVLVAGLSVVYLSGCANFNSIHRSSSFGKDGNAVYTDSKQRALLVNVGFDDKTNGPSLQYCLEPSADVFSVFASSLAAQAGLSESTNSAREAAFELSSTISENAATIERTQTINMLREMMYRNCERYISNAIDKTEFIVQSARDLRAMVAILAIEQLTGVQKAQATAITTLAQASAGGSSEESLLLLERARKERDTAIQQAAEARAAADALEPGNPCESVKSVASDSEKAKLCVAADNLERKSMEVTDYYNVVLSSIRQQGQLSATSEGKVSSAVLQGAAANENIAQTVATIVKGINDFDEIGMTCVVLLRQINTNNISELADGTLNDKFWESCVGLIQSEANRQIAINEDIAERVQARQTRTLSEAETLWQKLKDQEPVQRAQTLSSLASVADVTITNSLKKRLANAQDFDEFRRLFSRLPGDREKKALSNAALN